MPIETIQLWLRVTARCSGTVFMFAFAAAGWAVLLPALRGLAARRRALIVGFGALHTIHVGFVVWLGFVMGAAAFWKQFNIGLIIGGMMVLMMWGLVADALAPGRWPLFASRPWHAITEWAFFAIFTLAFTGHAAKDLRFLPLALLVLAALVGRIAWYVSRRRSRAATATA